MKLKHVKFRKLLLAAMTIVVFSLTACSQQGIYKGLQKQQEMRCNRVPEADYEACIEEAKKSYEDYQHQRGEVLK